MRREGCIDFHGMVLRFTFPGVPTESRRSDIATILPAGEFELRLRQGAGLM